MSVPPFPIRRFARYCRGSSLLSSLPVMLIALMLGGCQTCTTSTWAPAVQAGNARREDRCRALAAASNTRSRAVDEIASLPR